MIELWERPGTDDAQNLLYSVDALGIDATSLAERIARALPIRLQLFQQQVGYRMFDPRAYEQPR